MDNEKLVTAISEMQETDAIQLVEDLLEKNTNPMDIIHACQAAMDVIGKRFESGQAFIPELIMAGEIMKQISDIVKPRMTKEESALKKGTVMIGTVEGDIHDIGKDIVVFILDVNGYEVIDLGVDVPVQTFVEKIKVHQPAVVGLSGLLTLVFDAMKDTVSAIDAAGLRDNVKIMIGGAPVDEQVKNYTMADAWGKDAMEAVSLVKQWIGE